MSAGATVASRIRTPGNSRRCSSGGSVLVFRLAFIARMRPFIHELVDALQQFRGEVAGSARIVEAVEQRFLAERLQTHQILRIRVLAQTSDCPFIRQVLLFLDE